MKRKTVIPLVGLLLGASLTVTAQAPAHAALPFVHCVGDAGFPTTFGTVYVDSSMVVHVNPGAAQSDANAVKAAVFRLVNCMVDDVPDPVWCAYAKVFEIVGSIDVGGTNLRYVYPDGNGGYAINAPLILADATACA